MGVELVSERLETWTQFCCDLCQDQLCACRTVGANGLVLWRLFNPDPLALGLRAKVASLVVGDMERSVKASSSR